jgi:hypothetical protein
MLIFLKLLYMLILIALMVYATDNIVVFTLLFINIVYCCLVLHLPKCTCMNLTVERIPQPCKIWRVSVVLLDHLFWLFVSSDV